MYCWRTPSSTHPLRTRTQNIAAFTDVAPEDDKDEWYGLEYTLELSIRERRALDMHSFAAREHSKYRAANPGPRTRSTPSSRTRSTTSGKAGTTRSSVRTSGAATAARARSKLPPRNSRGITRKRRCEDGVWRGKKAVEERLRIFGTAPTRMCAPTP
ncbi:hypothetical protein C8J57DRAFT_331981 [Mycena rebaudengoi]|nr:hypothetical protein C8J57DRAFT_331981 [Mycena rebaudengoi]